MFGTNIRRTNFPNAFGFGETFELLNQALTQRTEELSKINSEIRTSHDLEKQIPGILSKLSAISKCIEDQLAPSDFTVPIVKQTFDAQLDVLRKAHQRTVKSLQDQTAFSIFTRVGKFKHAPTKSLEEFDSLRKAITNGPSLLRGKADYQAPSVSKEAMVTLQRANELLSSINPLTDLAASFSSSCSSSSSSSSASSSSSFTDDFVFPTSSQTREQIDEDHELALRLFAEDHKQEDEDHIIAVKLAAELGMVPPTTGSSSSSSSSTSTTSSSRTAKPVKVPAESIPVNPDRATLLNIFSTDLTEERINSAKDRLEKLNKTELPFYICSNLMSLEDCVYFYLTLILNKENSTQVNLEDRDYTVKAFCNDGYSSSQLQRERAFQKVFLELALSDMQDCITKKSQKKVNEVLKALDIICRQNEKDCANGKQPIDVLCSNYYTILVQNGRVKDHIQSRFYAMQGKELLSLKANFEYLSQALEMTRGEFIHAWGL